MKRTIATVLKAVIIMACWHTAHADTMDTDGYPVMYLRGELNGWGATNEHRMTRQGNHYSITLESLDGLFKVSSDQWKFNYGGGNPATEFNTSAQAPGIPEGSNYRANALKDVTVEFDINYDPANGQFGATTLSLTTSTVPDPNPEGVLPTGTLPVLYINVYNEGTQDYDNSVIDRDLDHKDYFTGEYWLDCGGKTELSGHAISDIGSKDAPLPLEIKARGNWTRKGFAKKPFKLKLGSKQSMLGLSKSKHFAILAHADDNMGYLRNFTGFLLGRRIGLPWTPDQQPCEVVINGNYRGIYFLTESIRIEKGRIDITESPDNATESAQISGGYLVELDNYDEENQIQMQEKTCTYVPVTDVLRITWDTPEVYSDLQRRFVTEQFTAMNNAIGDKSDDLWRYMDMDDAARYYIVEEAISHTEAYHGSTYLFRDNGEGRKWHFSPLWDCGNAFNGPTDDWFYLHSPFGSTWIPSMRCNDKFMEKVRATWQWFITSAIGNVEQDLQEYAQTIAPAAARDRERWKDAPRPSYPGATDVVDNTDMAARLNTVTNHLNAKLNWLKTQWGNPSQAVAEPVRDNTAAAPLPDYAVDAVMDINAEHPGTDSPAIWYNLQGIKVRKPVHGNIYIVIRDGQTTKVRF